MKFSGGPHQRSQMPVRTWKVKIGIIQGTPKLCDQEKKFSGGPLEAPRIGALNLNST